MSFATAVKNWRESPKGHIGAAGLPDMGVTEFISDALGRERNTPGSDLTLTGDAAHVSFSPVPQLPASRVKINENYGSNFVNSNPQSIAQPTPDATNNNNQNTDTVGGGGSGSTGGGVSATAQANKVDPNQALLSALQSQLGQSQGVYQSLMEREAAAQQAREQAARLGYQNILEQSERMQNQAARDRDQLAGNISDRYSTLSERLNQQRAGTQERFDTNQSQLDYNYAKAQAQARKNFQDTERRNRMVARATNRGDSSFYDDIMEENATNLDANLTGVGTERENKYQDLYSQLNQANTQFDQSEADIKMQENDMIQQVEKQYLQDIETAKQLAAQGLVDYNSAVAGVQSNAANSIAQIQAAAQNSRLNQAQVGASFQQMLANLSAINPQGVDSNLSNALLAGLQGQNVAMGKVDNSGASQALQMALARSSGGKLDDISKLLGR